MIYKILYHQKCQTWNINLIMFRIWLELLILIFKIHQVCPKLPDSDEGQAADWGGSRKGDYLGEVGVDEFGVGVGDAGDLGEAGLVWVWVVADGFGGVGFNSPKKVLLFHFPSKSLSLSCHRPPGDFEEDLILIANKETSHYLCSHHQSKYHHCHHCQSSLPPFRLSPTMPWMKSTFGKHPAGCLWRIRWETKICVLFLCVFWPNMF